MKETGRSLARIETSDLLRLAALAAQAEAGLFARHPDGAGRYTGPAAQLRSCVLSRAACRVRWSRSGRLGADRAASA